MEQGDNSGGNSQPGGDQLGQDMEGYKTAAVNGGQTLRQFT